MPFVQAEVKFKKPVNILNRGDVAKALYSRIAGFKLKPSLKLVDVTIQVKIKNAVWKTAGYAPAANPETSLSDYAQWLLDFEGVVYEDISQVCNLNISSFYADVEAIVVQVNER